MKKKLYFLDELMLLNLPSNQYVVFGSGPLAAKGLRYVNDLDIIVMPDLWNKLEEKYRDKKVKDDVIRIGNIEIFKSWIPPFENTKELIDTADVIDGIRFVKLEYVLKWKQMLNREKDKEDIKLIQDYLK